MKIYLIMFLFLVSTTLVSAQRKKDDETVVVSTEGVIYSLPRTGIRINVQAKQEKFFHGPYFQYAEAMLGLKNAPSADFESWTITDIQIETFCEADPDQVYKSSGVGASMLNLTESGILAGINSESGPGDDALTVSTFLGDTKTPDYPFADLSLNPFFEVGDSTARRRALVTKSLEEKAQEAAHTITKLRKRRFKSLANAYEEQLPDGRAYELMVEELDKLEAEYVGLFVGKTYTKTFDYSFDFIPGGNSVSGEVAFRFSETKGVLPKTDLSGKPVVVDVKKLDNLASAQEKLNVKGGPGGVYYRIPGQAEIRMMNGMNLIAVTRATIAQFGTVAPLPESLLDGTYRVTFHPKTGAIKSVLDVE